MMETQDEQDDALSKVVLDSAFAVHKEMGSGLLEAIYEECLLRELQARNVLVERQRPIALRYRGESLPHDFRLDLLIAGRIVVEIKAVEKLLPLHEAQLLSYLRLTNLRLGLLINFHTPLLKDGIKRMVLRRDS